MDKNIETYIDQIIKGLNCDEDDKNELFDEMKDHLYLLKNEFLEEGLTDEEATQKALKSFGEQKQLINEYQESLFPFYKLFKFGTRVVFGLYTIVLFYHLLFKRIIIRILDYVRLGETRNQFFFYPKGTNNFFDVKVWQENSNIIPFQTTLNYLKDSERYNQEVIINNTLGNILIFLPLGFFLPILFKKYKLASRVFVVSFIISLSFEILQFVLQLGQFDIDDIILNVIGSMIGFSFIQTINKITKLTKRKNLQRTTT